MKKYSLIAILLIAVMMIVGYLAGFQRGIVKTE